MALELRPPSPRSSSGVLLLAVFAVAALLVAGLWKFRERPEEPSIPSVVAGRDLPADLRLEDEQEAAREKALLGRVLDKIAAVEKEPVAGTNVPAAKVEEIVRQLARLEEVASAPDASPDDLKEAYEEVDDLWRDRLRSLQGLMASPPSALPFDVPPLRPHLEDASYRRLHAQVRERAARLAEQLRRGREADLQGRAERLRRTIVLRAAILKRLRSLGSVLSVDDPARWFGDAVTEVSSYPTRKLAIMELELVDVRRRSPGDFALGLNVLQELGRVFLIVLLPLLAVRGAARADRPGAPGALRAAVWVGAWVLAALCGPFLEGTLGEALRPLPDLVGYYALYRVYTVGVATLAVPVIERVLLEENPDRPVPARRPLENLGRLVLARALALRLLLAVAGPGVLLNTATSLFDTFLPLLCWLVAWSWRAEVATLVRHLVPAPLGPRLADGVAAPRTGWLMAPVGLVVVLLLGTAQTLLAQASRYESGKRLSAGLLRRWMETALDRETPTLPPAPAKYRKDFLSAAADPFPDLEDFLRRLHEPVDRWLAGEEGEPVLTVHGPPGADPGPLVRSLAARYSGTLRVLELRPSGRLTTAAALREALGGPLEPATLVLVPDAARLFLATVGGFEAWRELQVLARKSQHAAFWVLMMGTPTRNFLRHLSAGDIAMSRALAAPRWSDEALRRMILARHEASGLPYRFDSAVVLAARAVPGTTPETQYFQVLWQQSAGIAEVAQELWLASVRVDPAGGLRVTLPPRNPQAVLTAQPPVVGFVLAALFRHGALDLAEAARVTSMTERRVFLACELLLEAGILEHGRDGRMVVSRLWLPDVSSYLEGRNLLDG